MDEQNETLRKKLDELLKEAAEVELELSRREKAVIGIPHYTVIESRAHELGRQFSRTIQERQMREMAATAPRKAKCPTCRKVCDLKDYKRTVTSIDGPLEVLELKGYCSACRRDFFPSSGTDGFQFTRADTATRHENGHLCRSNASVREG